MATTVRHTLEIPAAYRSTQVALFMAQLADQSRRLTDDTRDLTPEALAWQPAPGMNTMGMLLAHIAVVEVWWTRMVLIEGPAERSDVPKTDDILGIGVDDDGIPLAEGGAPPEALAGRAIGFYDDLLARARANLVEVARGIGEAELAREITRVRPDGTRRVLTARWTLYHLLEHLAGHYGQILMLRHHHRVAAAPVQARAGD